MGKLLRRVLVLGILAATPGWVLADPACEAPTGPQPTIAQEELARGWIRMLGRIGPAAGDRLRQLDADLTGEERYRQLCEMSQARNLSECLEELDRGPATLWAGFGLYAAMGFEDALLWLDTAAARESSRLLAGTLRVALGRRAVADLLSELSAWASTEEQTLGLRMLRALPPEPGLVPLLADLVEAVDPRVRAEALALRTDAGFRDHAAELDVIAKCPDCGKAFPFGDGQWRLLADRWSTMSEKARAEALLWTSWNSEAREWAWLASASWSPESIAALSDAIGANGAEAAWNLDGLRRQWLRSLAFGGVDSIPSPPVSIDTVLDEPVETGKWALEGIVRDLDPDRPDDAELLRSLTRHANPLVAIVAGQRLAAWGDQASLDGVVEGLYRGRALPRWVLHQLEGDLPLSALPSLLLSIDQGAPGSVCSAMTVAADALASHHADDLSHRVAQAWTMVSAQSRWSWSDWEPALGGVLQLSGEEHWPSVAGAACLLRFGVPALRRVGHSEIEKRVDVLASRSDPAAHLLWAWTLTGTGDPHALGAIEAMQNSGADAVVHEADTLSWDIEQGAE